MDQKLNTKPKHIDEFINYTMSIYEEYADLEITLEDITKVTNGDINWLTTMKPKPVLPKYAQ